MIGKVAWNSKNGKMVGLAMNSKDAPLLADLDPDNNEEGKAAEYFLQFLWRDLTSDFDVIGPHYSTAHSMDCAFTLACLMDTLDVFQAYGFKVNILSVCVCVCLCVFPECTHTVSQYANSDNM